MNRDSIRISLIAIVLSVLGFAVAYQFVEPSPPKHLTLAAGSKTGAYHAFAARYAAILSREGISVEVLETGGSVDNIALLAEGKADVAFVQGGVGNASAQPSFRALGSLYFEPLWVFVRSDASVKVLSDLAKRPIAAGGEGSGTWAVTRQLLELNGVATEGDDVKHLSNADAVRALQNGEVDAAFFVASPTAPLVADLLSAKGLRLLNFQRARAYTSQLRHLSTVTLHRGVVSLSRDIPPTNLTLLAPAANLVTTASLHPALVQLLAGAMIEVHSAGGLFETPGQFPSALYTDYPMSPDAQRYLKDGQPFLQRFMPFWAAVLFDRLIILAVPLVTLMFPLMKVLPPVYRWRVRSRIFRWYGDLADIERRAHAGESKIVLAQDLSAMADEVRSMKVPLSYTDEVFNLRLHIELVRRELHV
ncbi:MAG TPA: TAXI family TRAP transporter solute-binding subunit [Magnetovibrio sp.]